MKAMETPRRPITQLDCLAMRRQFSEEAKPWIDMKIKIYSYSMPTFIIGPGDKMEQKFNFSPETEATLLLIDDQIDAIRLRISGAD